MTLHKVIIAAIVWAVCVTSVLAITISAGEQPDKTATDHVYCGSLDDEPRFTAGDIDDGGLGILLRDQDYTNNLQAHYFFLYENARDTQPWKYTLLNPGSEVFISFCPTFQGRLVRGNPQYNLDGKVHNLGTWVELSLEGPPSTRAWGDISLLEGCDGAATVAATDNSNVTTGFTQDMITGAPAAVMRAKDDGSPAIAKTVGQFASDAARDYELSLLDPMKNASIIDQYKPTIKTDNGRFEVTMYRGTY